MNFGIETVILLILLNKAICKKSLQVSNLIKKSIIALKCKPKYQAELKKVIVRVILLHGWGTIATRTATISVIAGSVPRLKHQVSVIPEQGFETMRPGVNDDVLLV